MTTMVRSESLFLSTLPGKYYYDPAIYEQEQEKNILAHVGLHWSC